MSPIALNSYQNNINFFAFVINGLKETRKKYLLFFWKKFTFYLSFPEKIFFIKTDERNKEKKYEKRTNMNLAI